MKKLLLLLLFIPLISFGQDQKLKVYLDCRCDDNYIKQQTSFLEYVRDQDLADVEIIIRDIRTPTGTRSFEIQIDGNNEFKEIKSEYVDVRMILMQSKMETKIISAMEKNELVPSENPPQKIIIKKQN